MEFIRNHLALVREKGHEWQIKVAWKVVAMVAILSIAAQLAYQKSFDRKGLAQLAANGSVGTPKRTTAPERAQPLGSSRP
jgi:hypothetical protein